MNRQQAIALTIAAANLILMLLFPPYDYLSIERGNVPTFNGFHYAFGAHLNQMLNGNFLILEVIVVLINTGISWLLLRGPAVPPGLFGNRYQKAVLTLVALNLVAILLFPPFENYIAITKATLPTFDGFYFLFGNNVQRQIVTTILYIEVALVLINGGLLWLFFKDRGREKLSAAEIKALAGKLRNSRE
jgi:hypothetical protein